MSTTYDLTTAVEYAGTHHPLLLRVRTNGFFNRGADLTFLSAFPHERESLYPPLSYLKPTGHPMQISTGLTDGHTIQVMDVEVQR